MSIFRFLGKVLLFFMLFIAAFLGGTFSQSGLKYIEFKRMLFENGLKFTDFSINNIQKIKDFEYDGLRGGIVEHNGNIDIAWIVNGELFIGKRFTRNGVDLSSIAMVKYKPSRDDLGCDFSKLRTFPYVALKGTEGKSEHPKMYIAVWGGCGVCKTVERYFEKNADKIPFTIGLLPIVTGSGSTAMSFLQNRGYGEKSFISEGDDKLLEFRRILERIYDPINVPIFIWQGQMGKAHFNHKDPEELAQFLRDNGAVGVM